MALIPFQAPLLISMYMNRRKCLGWLCSSSYSQSHRAERDSSEASKLMGRHVTWPRAAPEDRDDRFVQIMSLERERRYFNSCSLPPSPLHMSPSFHFNVLYKATVPEFSIVPVLSFEWSVDQYSLGLCFPKHTRLIWDRIKAFLSGLKCIVSIWP